MSKAHFSASCARPPTAATSFLLTKDYGCPINSSKSQILGLEQTIWADKFWGIWGIFGRFISAHFGTVSLFSMFSINQPLFPQKSKALYTSSKYLFGIGIGIWAAKN